MALHLASPGLEVLSPASDPASPLSTARDSLQDTSSRSTVGTSHVDIAGMGSTPGAVGGSRRNPATDLANTTQRSPEPPALPTAAPPPAASPDERRKMNRSFGPIKFLDRLLPNFNKPGAPQSAQQQQQQPYSSLTSLYRTDTRESGHSGTHSPSSHAAGHERVGGTQSGPGSRTGVRIDGTIQYLRVRSRHKNTRLLNRLFLAQQLNPIFDWPAAVNLSPRSSRYAPSIAGSVGGGPTSPAQKGAATNTSTGSLTIDTSCVNRSRVGSNASSHPSAPPGRVMRTSIPGGITTNANLSNSSLIRSPGASPRPSLSHPGGHALPEAVFCLKFSQNGKYLASGGQGSVVRVWRLRDPSHGPSTSNHPLAGVPSFDNLKASDTHSIRTNPESETPYTAPSESAFPGDSETSDSQIPSTDSFSIFEDAPYREYHGHTRDILDLSWSKHDFLLSSSMDKTVRLWHISRQECLCCFHHIDFVTSIAFHPRDDRFFLSGSLDGKVRLWNIPEKKVASWTELPDGHLITAVGFASKEGTIVAAGSHRGLCVFYETDGLKYHTQIQVRSTRGRNARGHKITGIQAIPSASFGEDKLLITSNDSRIRLYNMKDKSLERKYKGHVNNSSQIRATFSPDGKRIICGSEDHNIYIWDTQPSIVHKTVYQDSVYYTQAPMLLSSNAGGGAFKRRDRDQVGIEWFAGGGHSIVTAAIFAPPETVQWLSQHHDSIFSNQAVIGSGQSVRSCRTNIYSGPSSLSMSQLGSSTTGGGGGAPASDIATPDDASERSAIYSQLNGSRPGGGGGGTIRSLHIGPDPPGSAANLPQSGAINQDIIITAGYDGVIRVYRCDTRPEGDIMKAQQRLIPRSKTSIVPTGGGSGSSISRATTTLAYNGGSSRLGVNPNTSTQSVLSGLSLGGGGSSVPRPPGPPKSQTAPASANISDVALAPQPDPLPPKNATAAVAAAVEPFTTPTITTNDPPVLVHGRTSVESTNRFATPSIFEFFGLTKKKNSSRARHQSEAPPVHGPMVRRRSTTLPGQTSLRGPVPGEKDDGPAGQRDRGDSSAYESNSDSEGMASDSEITTGPGTGGRSEGGSKYNSKWTSRYAASVKSSSGRFYQRAGLSTSSLASMQSTPEGIVRPLMSAGDNGPHSPPPLPPPPHSYSHSKSQSQSHHQSHRSESFAQKGGPGTTPMTSASTLFQRRRSSSGYSTHSVAEIQLSSEPPATLSLSALASASADARRPRFTTTLSSSLRKSLTSANVSSPSPSPPATSTVPNLLPRPPSRSKSRPAASGLFPPAVPPLPTMTTTTPQTKPPTKNTGTSGRSPPTGTSAVSGKRPGPGSTGSPPLSSSPPLSCPNCQSANVHTFDVVLSGPAVVHSPPAGSQKAAQAASVIPRGQLTICLECRAMIS